MTKPDPELKEMAATLANVVGDAVVERFKLVQDILVALVDKIKKLEKKVDELDRELSMHRKLGPHP